MKRTIIFLIAIVSFAVPLHGQDGAHFEQVINNGFAYRNLGPFRVSAWVSDIAVPETPGLGFGGLDEELLQRHLDPRDPVFFAETTHWDKESSHDRLWS